MTPAELSIRFFLQLAVIVAACRGVGWIARRYSASRKSWGR
jgi:hypothetical protein